MNILIDEYKAMTGYERINLLKVIYNRLFNAQFKARFFVQKIQKTKCRIKKSYLRRRLMNKYGIVIGNNTVVGKNLSLQHVEVGGTILAGKIGNNCIIYHQVTLGNKNDKYPQIGNNVTIYSGAKIIGNIHIGDNVVIGTNAVVLESVPDNSVVAGVPAKIVRRL